MRFENFYLIDNETTDSLIIKRDFPKIYRQQAARLIDSDQNNAYIFGEKNNYHQVESSYLRNEKDVAISANRVLVDRKRKVIRLYKCFCVLFQRSSFKHNRRERYRT